MESCSNKTCEVRHVDPQLCSNFVSDFTEGFEVEVAWVGRPPGHNHFGLAFQCGLAHLVHVQAVGRFVHTVGSDVVETAREVDLHAVGQVATVRQAHSHECVTGASQSVHHCRVCLRTRVRLHVSEVRAEEFFHAVNREVFCDVYVFAPSVVAAPRVSFRVLVCKDRPLRLQNGFGDEVFRSNHLECVSLTLQFVIQNLRDFRIDLFERLTQNGGH